MPEAALGARLMGVMACDRAGCEEILCSRLILNRSRYLCEGCWQELQDYKIRMLREDAWRSAKDVQDGIERFLEREQTFPAYSMRKSAEDEFDRLVGGDKTVFSDEDD
jgi:hypothetical protein